jgi:Glycosyl transferase family 2
MPFFNHGMFVGDAVDSVRKQSRAVDQIVIVDDGSTDPHSLAVLEDLQTTGVTVIRQSNQGPGAARNQGVLQSDGDAVFFLDSDDVVTERHVEVALVTLADAPEEVGFVYPDMQFYGNERDLVVMPPYNLYMLLDRNFCCMGGLVDRAVFEAGNQFRADLLHGHEDWDFFITLGERGIFGRPFHGAPLLYRRWGYSRSDGVKEKGTFLREVRDLHPRLNDSHRLIEIKREWAPALSIVVPTSIEQPVASQTCDDFEVVRQVGDTAPPVRGRWVLMLNDLAVGVLEDPTFVERVVRLAVDRADTIGISLHAPASPRPGWRASTKREAGPFLGMIVRGSTYFHWRETTHPTTKEFAPFFHHLDSLSEGGACWEYGGPGLARQSTGPPGALLSEFRPPRPPPGPADLGDEPHGDRAVADLAEQGGRGEQGFRLNETPPLLIPSGGYARLPAPPRTFRDGLEALTERAWSDWIPSRANRLDLVVDLVGQARLEAVDPHAPPAPEVAPVVSRLPVGWIWSQPFPGTTGLYSWFDLRTHSTSYRISDVPSGEKGEFPLGYLATEPLPGRFELRSALEECRHGLSDSQRITLPHIEDASQTVYVERATRAPNRRVAVSSSESPAPASARRWPLFEVALVNGEFRYTRQPDACVGRNDVLRSFPTVIAELGETTPGSTLSTLFEVRYSEGGGIGYVSGIELASSAGAMYPVQALGTLTEGTDAHVPLVRLSPGPAAPAAAVPPGHRLAIAWQPLVEAGYAAEGVVGYASQPDPTRLPLYRWWNVAHGTWLISLGEDESRRFPHLQFDGTLGRAWSPGSPNVGHIDLWEMERQGTMAYATDRSLLEASGFVARRIVARLLREQQWGTVPLLSVRSADGGRGILTTCAAEGEWLGLTDRQTLGFVEAAVPGPMIDSDAAATPPWAVAVDEADGAGNLLRGYLFRDPVPGGVAVRRSSDGSGRLSFTTGPHGPGEVLGFALARTVPFGQPVYAVGEEEVVTSELPFEGDRNVHGVLFFLAAVEFTEGPVAPAGGRGWRARTKSVATGSLLRKVGLARVLPPTLRRRFRQFVR